MFVNSLGVSHSGFEKKKYSKENINKSLRKLRSFRKAIRVERKKSCRGPTIFVDSKIGLLTVESKDIKNSRSMSNHLTILSNPR